MAWRGTQATSRPPARVGFRQISVFGFVGLEAGSENITKGDAFSDAFSDGLPEGNADRRESPLGPDAGA